MDTQELLVEKLQLVILLTEHLLLIEILMILIMIHQEAVVDPIRMTIV